MVRIGAAAGAGRAPGSGTIGRMPVPLPAAPDAALAHVDPAAVDAVLFDMDGTLIDSTAAVERAWTRVALRHGLDVDDVLSGIHGIPAAVSLRRLLPDADDAALAAEVAEHEDFEIHDLDGVVALPGAAAILALLDERRTPWAVVTSAMPELARARLGAAGIVPPILVTPRDVPRGKPAPDGFVEGARRCGVAPDRCLAVEDSPGGLAAARASGAVVVDVGPGGVTLTALLARLQGRPTA